MTQFKNTVWLCLFGLIIVLVPQILIGTQIPADNQILERAYLEDPTRELSFAHVLEKQPARYQGILGKGFSKSHHWIRLKLRRPETSSELILRIRPQFLDEIELFVPDAPSQTRGISGDKISWQESGYRSLNHTFVVRLSEPVQIVWLRVYSTGPILVNIDAFAPEAMQRIERSSEFVGNIYIGMMLFVLLFSIFVAMSQSDLVAWAFVALQLSSICLAFSSRGHLRLWFSHTVAPETLNALNNQIVLANGVVSLIFYVVLVKLHQAPRWGVRIATGAIAAYPFLFVLVWLDQTRIAMNVYAVVALLTPLTLMFISLGVRKGLRHDPESPFLPRSSLVIFFGMLTVAFSLSSLPILGIISPPTISIHNLLLPTIINDLMMMSLLYWRSKNIERAELRKAENLKVVERELAFQSTKTKELSQFMAMLTHELKTPLSIVRIAMSSAHQSQSVRLRAQHAILDMNAVIDRCIQMMKVDEVASSVDLADLDLMQLLTELKDGSEQPTRVRIEGPARLNFRTDRGLCSIIFRNFISNALKYGARDEALVITVEMQAHDQQTSVRIQFSNDVGPAGMPDAGRVFEKFYRGPGAHSMIGAGLGLFLARALARELGGDVIFRPDRDIVRFALWLPCQHGHRLLRGDEVMRAPTTASSFCQDPDEAIVLDLVL